MGVIIVKRAKVIKKNRGLFFFKNFKIVVDLSVGSGNVPRFFFIEKDCTAGVIRDSSADRSKTSKNSEN